jgi:serine/threonine protein kinase
MSNELHRNALPPGHRLHWYLIERVLGQGGFGITYLARDENLDQSVAIKEFLPSEIAVRAPDGTIQPRSTADAEQYRWGKERFLAEARTLARFNHPNIIQVFSVFEANHTAYMVMRYEQGESLRAILKTRKHLSEEELLGICLPICEGLARVHAAGFIHRDIQPSNIYIRDDGSPVLLDFGAARRTMGNPRTLTILVAPGYAPIEQYYSSGAEQGPWTDIYGLGATLYRAVSGAAPIDAIERSRGMLGSSRDMLVPAAVVGDGRYSERFLRAIDHALRFNDKERPRDLREWMAELRGESQTAPSATRAAAAAPGRAAPPAAAAPAPPPAPRPAPRPTAVAAAPARTSRMWAAASVLTLLVSAGAWFLLAPMPERAKPEIRNADVGTAAPAATAREGPPGSAPGFPVAAESAAPPDSDGGDRIESSEREPAVDPGPAAGSGTPAPHPADTATAAQDAGDLTRNKAELTALLQQVRTESARLEALRKSSGSDSPASGTRGAPDAAPPDRHPAVAPTPEATPAGPANAAPAEPPVASPPAGPPPADAEFRGGLEALAAGSFESALRQLLPLAQANHAGAQYHVGLLYRNGQGVLADNLTALGWLRKAAWQNHADAQVALARLYAEGIDGRRDPFLAYVWYLRAERNGALATLVERREVEGQLQPEQLPQAAALAVSLSGPAAAAATGAGATP